MYIYIIYIIYIHKYLQFVLPIQVPRDVMVLADPTRGQAHLQSACRHVGGHAETARGKPRSLFSR